MELLKTKEVCNLLRVDKKTLLALVKKGKIPCIKVSERSFRFPKDEILAFLQKNIVGLETKAEEEKRVKEIVNKILKEV